MHQNSGDRNETGHFPGDEGAPSPSTLHVLQDLVFFGVFFKSVKTIFVNHPPSLIRTIQFGYLWLLNIGDAIRCDDVGKFQRDSHAPN